MVDYSPEEFVKRAPRVDTVFLENKVLDPEIGSREASILENKERSYRRILSNYGFYIDEGEKILKEGISENDERKRDWLLRFHNGRFGEGRPQDIMAKKYSASSLHKLVDIMYNLGKEEAMQKYYMAKGRLRIVKQLQKEKIEED